MNGINTVVQIGRLVRDAELRVTSGGLAICKFSIANNYRKKSGETWEDQTNFFDVVVMGAQAEALQPYLLRGKQVGIIGELRQNRWKDDAGNNRSRVEILSKNIQLLGGNTDKTGNQQEEAAGSQPSDGAEFFDDDVPF